MRIRCERLGRMGPIVAAIAVTTAASSPVLGDVIFQTEDPFGGPFGVIGKDVFIGQSVAVRFTPNADFDFDNARIWLWNNDESGGQPAITISLQNDITNDGDSVPGGIVLEQWELSLPNTGQASPQLFEFASREHPLLEQGVRYWIVAESESRPFIDPVWAIAALDSGISTTTTCYGCNWAPAANGAIPATIVDASPHVDVPGDVDGDGSVGVGDLLVLLADWGPCGDCNDCPADFDDDCTVGISDLLILLANWG